MGCTLNCDPNWLSVFSPRIASVATRALNCGLYCFLVVVIELSLSMTPPNFSLLPGLKSWDHYRFAYRGSEWTVVPSDFSGDGRCAWGEARRGSRPSVVGHH